MNILKIIYEKNQPNLIKANTLLLILVVIMLIVVPFLPVGIQDILNKSLLTAIFFTSIFALDSRSRILFPIALLLTLIQWIAKFLDKTSLEMISGSLSIIFFMYIVIRLIRQFSTAKTVSPVVILGSVNGYLLMGFVFSLLVILVSGIYANSFYSAPIDAFLTFKTDLHTYIYYVFITMATVGYGDITPISPAARALAVMIAVSGQLYMAVVIAFLVGKFAGAERRKDK